MTTQPPRRRLTALLTTGTVAVAATAVALVTTAVPASAMCAPDPYDRVDVVGRSYPAIGDTVGKYNGSTLVGGLHYSRATTVTRSTTLEVGAKVSLSWAIASVEVNTKYSVTKTTTAGTTVTDDLSIPGHYYGYIQPKAQITRFHLTRWQTAGNCKYDYQTTDYGYIDAITAVPFFAECVSTGPCTPKP